MHREIFPQKNLDINISQTFKSLKMAVSFSSKESSQTTISIEEYKIVFQQTIIFFNVCLWISE